jgi:hypothetical protein
MSSLGCIKKSPLIVVTLLIVLLVAFKPDPPKKVNLIFIGDSITFRAGLNDRNLSAPPIFALEYWDNSTPKLTLN